MDDRRHRVPAAAESRTAAATSGGTTVGMTRKAAAGGVIDVPGTVSRPVTLRVANGLLCRLPLPRRSQQGHSGPKERFPHGTFGVAPA